MKHIIVLLLTVLTSQLSSQPTKKETVKTSFPTLKEVFYVLKSNHEIRHGEYEKTSRGKLICKGQYEHGERSGIWEYFDTDQELTHKVDYANFKLIFPKGESSKSAEVLGGYSQLYQMIAYTMMYPAEARRMGTQGKVVVKFTVDKKGQLKNFIVTSSLGNGLDEEAIRALKECKMDWFPARNPNGEPVDSEVELPVTFRLG
ncbi:MAG: energy transducer TonB [Bacteroidota bacterium]